MQDIISDKILLDTLHVLTNELAYNMQSDKQLALNFGIKLKKNFDKVQSFSMPLSAPTNKDNELFKVVRYLFDDYYESGAIYRFCGVFTNRVTPVKNEVKQLSIFDDFDEVEKEYRIKKLLDSINKEYGSDLIKKGV